jgi:hypothetical protein
VGVWGKDGLGSEVERGIAGKGVGNTGVSAGGVMDQTLTKVGDAVGDCSGDDAPRAARQLVNRPAITINVMLLKNRIFWFIVYAPPLKCFKEFHFHTTNL